MRALLMVAAVLVLAGCSEFRREFDSGPPPPNQTVSVKYKGPDGLYLAGQKANEWCDAHVGQSDARLVKNNRKAKSAIFACEPL
jgi:hypothetical protein